MGQRALKSESEPGIPHEPPAIRGRGSSFSSPQLEELGDKVDDLVHEKGVKPPEQSVPKQHGEAVGKERPKSADFESRMLKTTIAAQHALGEAKKLLSSQPSENREKILVELRKAIRRMPNESPEKKGLYAEYRELRKKCADGQETPLTVTDIKESLVQAKGSFYTNRRAC